MQPEKIIPTLEEYAVQLEGILSRFSFVQRIDAPDAPVLKRLVRKLVDLYMEIEHMARARKVESCYYNGCQNIDGMPTFKCVQELKNMVRNDVTRLTADAKAAAEQGNAPDPEQVQTRKHGKTQDRLGHTRTQDRAGLTKSQELRAHAKTLDLQDKAASRVPPKAPDPPPPPAAAPHLAAKALAATLAAKAQAASASAVAAAPVSAAAAAAAKAASPATASAPAKAAPPAAASTATRATRSVYQITPPASVQQRVTHQPRRAADAKPAAYQVTLGELVETVRRSGDAAAMGVMRDFLENKTLAVVFGTSLATLLERLGRE